MEVKVTDHDGNPITQSKLKRLNLWNQTTDHVCASTLQRLKETGEFDIGLTLKIGK